MSPLAGLHLLEREPPVARSRLPPWIDEFRRWAQGEADPEQPPSLLPLLLLFSLALLLQGLQFYVPGVAAFLRDGDVTYRPHWMAFTLAKQWALFVLVVVVLRADDEDLSRLGFPAFSLRRWMIAASLIVLAAFVAVVRTSTVPTAPSAPPERLLSVVMAFTAAVVEETFFRGLAIVRLYRWSGSLAAAVIVPAAVFAAGHAYLGWLNVAFAFAAALLFSAVFVWRRDLYWPMVAHFLVNAAALLE